MSSSFKYLMWTAEKKVYQREFLNIDVDFNLLVSHAVQCSSIGQS